MVDFVRRAQAVTREAVAIAGTRPRALTEGLSRFLGSVNIWFWAIVGLPTLIAGVYFFAIASDLYSSEVKFIVRGPNKAPTSAISAIAPGLSMKIAPAVWLAPRPRYGSRLTGWPERAKCSRSLQGFGS